MKILILEHNRHFSGHRVPYARRIAEAVQSISGTQVIVGFPEPIRSEERLADYFPQSDAIATTFYPLPESKDGLTHCRRVASQFWQMVATIHPDYVLIPTADKLATVLAVQMQTRYRRQNRNFSTDILLMRSDLQSGRISLPGIRNQLDRQVVRWGGWNRVLHLDPLTWSRSRGRLELCPDPVPALDQSDRHQARQLLNLPARQPIIASLGNQNHDKGVDQLLRAFFHGPHCDDFCLLLAGPMSRTLAEQVRQYTEIGKGKSRLIVWDRLPVRDAVPAGDDRGRCDCRSLPSDRTPLGNRLSRHRLGKATGGQQPWVDRLGLQSVVSRHCRGCCRSGVLRGRVAASCDIGRGLSPIRDRQRICELQHGRKF